MGRSRGGGPHPLKQVRCSPPKKKNKKVSYWSMSLNKKNLEIIVIKKTFFQPITRSKNKEIGYQIFLLHSIYKSLQSDFELYETLACACASEAHTTPRSFITSYKVNFVGPWQRFASRRIITYKST